MIVALVAGGPLLAACSSATSPVADNRASGTVTGPRATVVDGVPLAPLDAEQRSECKQFASELNRPIPCPGLLPVPIPVSASSTLPYPCFGQLGEEQCGPAIIETNHDEFFLNQSNFEVPPGYVGVTVTQYGGTATPVRSIDGGSLGHFVFTAQRQPSTPLPTYCSPLSAGRTPRVRTAVASIYQCASSGGGPGTEELIMGHDLLEWDAAGFTCEVSFHGHSRLNLDLDLAVARAVTLVASH